MTVLLPTKSKMTSKILVFQHVPHEGPGTLESFLESRGAEIERCRLYEPKPFPKNPKAYQWIISMGGPMNVDETDRYHFLAEERNFLREAIGGGIPVLGICLGAQLIARALGARVRQGARKEIGWYPVRFSKESKTDPVFGNCSGQDQMVFHWHGDTFDLPEGAVCLASSHLYENQAFLFGSSVYALQFHLEVTAKMIRDWIEVNQSELHSAGLIAEVPSIHQNTQRYEPGLQAFSRKVYEHLSSVVSLESSIP